MNKIIVSHPGIQHTFHLVEALDQREMLLKYYSGLIYTPHLYPFKYIELLPGYINNYIKQKLNGRLFNYPIDFNKIEQLNSLEILRHIINKVLFFRRNDLNFYTISYLHDLYVSKKIESLNADAVIGYELSSLNTFKRARKLGVTTILDFSSVHYSKIESLSKKYPDFDDTMLGTDKTLGINDIKLQEYNLADHILCLSDYSYSSMIENGIHENKIHKINLGFDPLNFKLKPHYNYDGPLRVIFVGNVNRRKGVKLLLKAFNELKIDKELTFIGWLTDEINFDKYNSVSFVGKCGHDQLVNYYQKADVLVLPSYTDSWGLVVAEAMACGTPVIVSENVGAKELVRENENGFIVPVDDYKKIKEKLIYFHENRNKIEEYGRNAYSCVQKFTWDNYKRNIADLISGLE